MRRRIGGFLLNSRADEPALRIVGGSPPPPEFPVPDVVWSSGVMRRRWWRSFLLQKTRSTKETPNSLLLFGDPPFNCVLYASIVRRYKHRCYIVRLLTRPLVRCPLDS